LESALDGGPIDGTKNSLNAMVRLMLIALIENQRLSLGYFLFALTGELLFFL
jgi:hypothetical protein